MAVELEPRRDQDQEQWQLDLEKVGLVRRLLAGRKWYGADWWFVAIASAMVTMFFFVAAFPDVLAPHDPTEQVGPRFLAPGEVPDQDVMILPVGVEVSALADLAGEERIPTGVVRGAHSSQTIRDEADRVTEELKAAGDDRRVRLRIIRYDTLEETLDGLKDGETAVVAASLKEFQTVADTYPELYVAGAIHPETGSGLSFFMGTNQIGQDVWSRVLWGARVSLIIGFASAVVSVVFGVPLGLLAGFRGGRFDRAMTMFMDSLYAFPGLILAIAITAVLGPSVLNIILAIAVLYVPTYYRIVRGQTLSTKESLYVEAATSLGAKTRTILGKYIYPNVIPSVAIIFSVNVADAILTGAGLSFLGLGLPPTIPDWGIDISRGVTSMQTAWWIITFPGVAVVLVVLAFTLLGEGLMEIFNPKLRDR